MHVALVGDEAEDDVRRAPIIIIIIIIVIIIDIVRSPRARRPRRQ
jgi:hypothetical protein